ncbi:MAG: methyltransferase [Candidatus Nitrosocaldaceae archaeon]|nr:MAG: methyltransferase [Candidatus Nitrosocaldaceae archaeon]
MSGSKWIVNDIVCRDSRYLTDFIKPESVALTITSPPYRNAIDYDTHIANNKQRYRGKCIWGTNESDTKEYLKIMKSIFDQVYEVTIPGGYCCIVIGYEVVKGEIIPLPSLLLAKLLSDRKKKWKLREEIIWNKVTAGRNGVGNRFSVTAKSLKSKTTHFLNYYANIMHEYIFVLSKGDTKVRINKEDTLQRIMKLKLHPYVYRELANSVWNIAPVPPRSIDHPCPFPEQIPWRLIQLYSNPNDVVLDPMNGSGQTTKVAKYLNRQFIGVDKIEKYVELAKKRLDEPPNLSTLLWIEKWGSMDTSTWKEQSLEKYSC